MVVDRRVFDEAIDEWASTGVLPVSIKGDVDSIFKLIDLIPKFVQPLTKKRFLNVVDQILDLVYHKPEFFNTLIERINLPEQPTQRISIWLCCSLVPIIPRLAVQVQQSAQVATVVYKKSEIPHVYEILDHSYIGKSIILVFANGWSEYTSLLKSSKSDVARYTAAALYSEAKQNPNSIPIQLKLGLAEHAYRIFDKSTSFLPFLVSWMAELNNAANKSVLKWDQIKSILRKSSTSLTSHDKIKAYATFVSICDLVGESPWTQKKNICDKIVDLELHRKIIRYLQDSTYQTQALKLIDLMSETRAEELAYAGTLEFTNELENSDNESVKSMVLKINRKLRNVS